jgi:hypothetical protein
MGPDKADQRGAMWCTVDASFDTHTDGKGQTGYTVHMGRWEPALITCARKQKVGTRSSTDAEYGYAVAYSDVCSKVAWFKQVVEFAGYIQKQPIIIENDNMSALEIGTIEFPTKGVQHQKHFYHCFKSQVAKEEICFVYRETTELLADLLTKPLVGEVHDRHYERIRNGLAKEDQPEYLAQPEYILKQVLPEWQKLSRRIVNQQKSTPEIRGA